MIRKSFNLNFEADLLEQIDAEAKKDGRSRNNYLETVLKRMFRKI